MANSIQTIMRTSAMIYAEHQQSTRSKKTVERVFIESVLVGVDNRPLNVEQILNALQEDFSLTYQDYEIMPILGNEEFFGRTLREVLEENPSWLGSNVGKELPIMVKLIDAKKDLQRLIYPIQAPQKALSPAF